MKVKYFSEILNKDFETEVECARAEHEYNVKHNEKERLVFKEKVDSARTLLAEMTKEVEDARRMYNELALEYERRYNNPHRDENNNLANLINLLTNL